MRITLLACITCCLGAQAAQSQGSSGSLPMLYVVEFRPLSQPSSGNDLADQIAQKIVERATELSSQDAATP
jgi:hypothetical protein